MLNSSHRLFVYGTLAPGRANHRLLENLRGDWQEAEIRGTLYANGLGPTLGYPLVDLDQPTEAISGYLFSSLDLPDHWAALDEFEGAGYRRVITTVTLHDRAPVDAYVYALDHDLEW